MAWLVPLVTVPIVIYALAPDSVGTIAIAIAIVAVLIAIMMPRSLDYQPWRIFLPPLVGYTVLSTTLEPDARSQYRLLVLFVAGFAGACTLVFFRVGKLPSLTARRSTGIVVSTRPLIAAEVIGVAVYGWIYHSTGVPILLGGTAAQAARVATATPGHAAILIAGKSLLEIVLIVDLLAITHRLTIQGQRRSWRHVGGLALVLLSSSGRSDIIVPLAIAFVALLLSGWRDVTRTIIASVSAAALFLLIGSYRESGGKGLFAPAESYLRGTAQVNSSIQNLFGGAIPYGHGSTMLWFVGRLSGSTVTPPGIYLKDVLNRGNSFVGFGLETNVLGGWYMDWGTTGVAVGGVVMGLIATLVYSRWRRHGGWWTIAYAYITTWLLISIAVHPVASYWDVMFPIELALFIAANHIVTRRSSAGDPAPLGPVDGVGDRSDVVEQAAAVEL
jgi:hypothetical protein